MQVISLTNRRKIAMMVPTGDGNHVELNPGETKLVQGEFEHYRRMPGQGMTGLVVKVAQGEKIRLVEDAQQDFVRATVTNHRRIAILLSTGVGRQQVNIKPGETTEPIQVRLSVVKRMSGVSVRRVGSVEKLAEVTKPVVEKLAEALKPATEESAEAPKLTNGADVEALKTAVREDETLAKRRRDLSLPATRAEWDVRTEQLTWADVRGICKELDIKTKSSSKEELLAEIEKVLYPS